MIFLDRPVDFTPQFETVSCFCEFQGKILLLKRQHHKGEGGKWGIPAGKIDPGEEMLESMVRELYEETEIIARSNELNYLYQVFIRYPDFDFIFHVYSLKISQSKKITIHADEHLDFQWATPQEALKLELVKDMDACIRLCYGNK